MPERYRAAFDGAAVHEHAAIVARRTGLVHLEVWQRLPDGRVVLCVVADDKPGLLSFVSASLVTHGLDIVAMKAYTRVRRESGRAEAIDFVWVRRVASPSLAFMGADLKKIGDALLALVTGEATVESVLGREDSSRPPTDGRTRVRFDASPDDLQATLIVEAADRSGLLLTITQAIFRAGVQIVASDAKTQNGRAIDHFTLLERDGSPLGLRRRDVVQTEVLSAIEALATVRSKRKSGRPPKPGAMPR
jgi:UTP:GlnB (protein PII) uridylyltransferase